MCTDTEILLNSINSAFGRTYARARGKAPGAVRRESGVLQAAMRYASKVVLAKMTNAPTMVHTSGISAKTT